MSEIQNSMADFVPVREHEGSQVVSGRDLHAYLEVGRDYTNWFKQMVEYGFSEGQDFTPIMARSTGGRPSIDHAVSIDMGKQLGMIQRTERGRLVREYFIAVEKRAMAAPVELDRRALALMVIEAEDAREIAVQRAEVAESFKENIELNDGLTVRDFHKKYFSEHRETDVNQFFYDRGLLIDERNKRHNPETGERKDGKNHRRPTFQGKAFFYLHGELDRDKIRREKTRVRPGAPELALVEYMTKRGFVANTNTSKELHLV